MNCGTSLEESDYFGVECFDEGHRIRLEVRGELDRNAARILDNVFAVVAEAEPEALIIDASALTFCDSAGVKAVLRMRERCVESGIDLRVSRVRTSVLRVLELTGVSAKLTFDS